MFNKILIAGLCLAVSWVQGVQIRMYQNGPSSEALAAVAGLADKADKVLPYTPLAGNDVTVNPSKSYTWETTAGTNTLTASGFTAGIDASCSMIITMFEGDTITASGLTFVDELEPGVNHCFVRQMPTGLPKLFVSYSKPFTPEQLERLEQYGDMDIVPSDASWFVFSDGEITGFNYVAGREHVIIPYAIGGIPVTSIGGFAFFDVDAGGGAPIVSVTAPKTATSVGEIAFSSCTELTSVSFPSATSIGYSAFEWCPNLTTVSLPSATSVGDSAFFGCSALTTVSLPSATSVGEIAFSSCSALTTVSLPSATSIGYSAFEWCPNLTSITLGKTPPTWQAGPVDGATIYVPHDATGYGTTWNGMPVVTLGE